MKIEVTDLNASELHELMREEHIPCGVLKTVEQVTWLEYTARA
jgi:hypothetical protein